MSAQMGANAFDIKQRDTGRENENWVGMWFDDELAKPLVPRLRRIAPGEW